jgi:hypothetical protein
MIRLSLHTRTEYECFYEEEEQKETQQEEARPRQNEDRTTPQAVSST